MKIILTLLFITTLLLSNSSTSSKKLFLGNINYKPLMYEENSTQKGLIIDLTKAIIKEGDINAEIKLMNWANAQDMVNNNRADALIQINKTLQRKKLYDFSRPLFESNFYIYKNESNNEIYDLDSMVNKTIGVEAKGYPIAILKENPNIKIKLLDSWLEGFDLVSQGKIDGLVMDENLGDYLLSFNNYKNINKSYTPLAVQYSYIAVRKGDTELLSKINKGIDSINSTGIKKDILNNWKNSLVDRSKQNVNTINLTQEEKQFIKNNPTVDIGTYHVPPYIFSEKGNITGYIVDISNEVFSRLNIKPNYTKILPLKEKLDALKNKELDVGLGLIKNTQREKFLDYVYIPLGLQIGIFGKVNDYNITDYNNLNNKRIATYDGYAIADKYFKDYDNVRFVNTKNAQDMLEAVSLGKADVALQELNSANHLIYKSNLNNLELKSYTKDKFNISLFVVSKDNDLLNSIIYKAYQSIPFSVKNKYRNKWFNYNREKLNENEINFLNSKSSFDVCVRYAHYPISGVENNKMTGITGQIYNKLSQELNISFNPIKSNSLKEFRDNIKAGKCELISIAKNSYKGFDNFTFTKPILSQFYVSVGSIKNSYVNNLSAQKGHTFYLKDEVIRSEFLRVYPNTKVILNENIDEVMKIVSEDPKSHFILTTYTADETISKYGPSKYKIDDIFDNIVSKGAIAVNDKYPLLHTSINKILNSLSNQELAEIANNYRVSKYIVENKVNKYLLWAVIALIVTLIIYMIILKTRQLQSQKLEKEKEKFKTLLELSTDGIFIIDPKTAKLINNSKIVEKMIGYNEDELKDLTVLDWDKDVRNFDDFNEIVQNITYKPLTINRVYTRKDNTTYQASVTLSRIVLEGNEYIYSTVRDISELLEFKELKKLREKEKELLHTLKTSQNMAEMVSFKYDLTNKILDYDYDLNSFLCTNPNNELTLEGIWSNYIYSMDKEYAIELISEKMHTKEDYVIEYRFIINKKIRHIKELAKFDNSKNILYITLQDITKQKNQEIQIKELNENLENKVKKQTEELISKNEMLQERNEEYEESEEELRAQQAELEESQLRIEDLAKAKEKFLANMSHEIRTPLNGIIGIINMLQDHNIEDTYIIKKLDTLKISSNLLLSIVNDILDFSSLQSGNLKLYPKQHSLRDIIEHINNTVKNDFKEKNINFETIIEDDVEDFLYIDDIRFSQVVLNLLNNAKKFTKDGLVSLDIRTVSKDDKFTRLRLTIKDTGIGMSNDIQNKLFQEFTQGDYSNTKEYKGTGLGLVIVKKIIDLMDGRINVTSVEDIGTTFTITFSVPYSKSKVKLHTQDKIYVLNKPKKALLVEDDRINQMVLESVLRKRNFKIDIAENGLEALDKIRNKNEYDIVFMDIQMPIMDGLEATKEIRKFNKTIPIIALSAGVLPENINDSHLAGMNMHIMKPIDQKQLNEVVDNHFLDDIKS